MSADVLEDLTGVLEARKSAEPDQSYVAALHQKGLQAIAAKVLEEANETVEAARKKDIDQVIYESADLWFHNMVLLSHFDLNYKHVLNELSRRFGISGIVEKESRNR